MTPLPPSYHKSITISCRQSVRPLRTSARGGKTHRLQCGGTRTRVLFRSQTGKFAFAETFTMPRILSEQFPFPPRIESPHPLLVHDSVVPGTWPRASTGQTLCGEEPSECSVPTTPGTLTKHRTGVGTGLYQARVVSSSSDALLRSSASVMPAGPAEAQSTHPH